MSVATAMGVRYTPKNTSSAMIATGIHASDTGRFLGLASSLTAAASTVAVSVGVASAVAATIVDLGRVHAMATAVNGFGA